MKKFLPLSLLLAAQIATIQSAEVITDAAPSTENQTEVAEQPVATSDAQEAQKETAIPTKDTTNDNRWEALKAAEKKMKELEEKLVEAKKEYAKAYTIAYFRADYWGCPGPIAEQIAVHNILRDLFTKEERYALHKEAERQYCAFLESINPAKKTIHPQA